MGKISRVRRFTWLIKVKDLNMLKKLEITGNLFNDLYEIFSKKSMQGIFDQGLWIAGGFAREVCKIQLGLSNKNISEVIGKSV